ncbi:MAG: TetR/AcrR family transcriptional regulator [Steroidobacteraceae bacterium]|nr:TetR/AcrR family transcriptional regulator [Steroidobacteraceae bacterium]
MLNKSSATVQRKRRSRGRPRTAHSEDVREKLLRAARDLFMRYGYRAVSSRQIASAAGVNVAMIRYYFGGKPGLYREITNAMVGPLRAGIDAMSAGATQIELASLIGTAMRMWATNPWLPGLIVREVLMQEGPLRAMFIRDFPERLVPVLEKLVRREMERGRLRADLDPRLVVLSMISLGLFPFLALPVTSRVFGVRADEAFLQHLIRHTTDVLTRGIAVHDAPGSKK